MEYFFSSKSKGSKEGEFCSEGMYFVEIAFIIILGRLS
jgi:hypothetical protein